MERKLYNVLRERALYFLDVAKKDLENRRYDICLFHVEQSLQLLLKSYLIKTRGDFSWTTSLNDLFVLVKIPCLNRLKEDKWYMISILEGAYLGARYFAREYGEKEAKEAISFVEEAVKCINI